MRILNWELGRGKTTELVRIMLEPGNEDVIFVAPSMAQAEKLGYGTAVGRFGQDESPELKARFISVGQVHLHKGARFVIDEIGGVIGSLIGGEVLALSGTDENVKKGQVAMARERGYW